MCDRIKTCIPHLTNLNKRAWKDITQDCPHIFRTPREVVNWDVSMYLERSVLTPDDWLTLVGLIVTVEYGTIIQ